MQLLWVNMSIYPECTAWQHLFLVSPIQLLSSGQETKLFITRLPSTHVYFGLATFTTKTSLRVANVIMNKFSK